MLIGAGCSVKEGEYVITVYKGKNDVRARVKVKKIKT